MKTEKKKLLLLQGWHWQRDLMGTTLFHQTAATKRESHFTKWIQQREKKIIIVPENNLKKAFLCLKNDDYTLSTFIAYKTNNESGCDVDAAKVGLLNRAAAEKVSDDENVLYFFQKYCSISTNHIYV